MADWFLLAISALFTIAGVVTFFASGRQLSALGPTLFFGFCAAVAIRRIVEASRRRAALRAERVVIGGGVPIPPSRSRVIYFALAAAFFVFISLTTHPPAFLRIGGWAPGVAYASDRAARAELAPRRQLSRPRVP